VSGVSLTGTDVLARLRSACGTFSLKGSEALELASTEIALIRDWISERRAYWEREKAIATEHVETAQANLASCEASGYWDDDGNYIEPDCGGEESELAAAQSHLDECSARLATVEEWNFRVEAGIASFVKAKDSFEVLVLRRLPEAEHFLDTKHAQYTVAIASSVGTPSARSGPRTDVATSSIQESGASRKAVTRNKESFTGQGPKERSSPSASEPETPTNNDISEGRDASDHDQRAKALSATKELFERAGFRRGEPATIENVQALRALLTKSEFRPANSIVAKIATQSPNLTEAFLLNVVNDFSSMIPARIAEKLPQFEIAVADLGPNVLGGYDRGTRTLLLSESLDEFSARGTIFHEMGHWFHNNGPQWYRDAVAAHFHERTVGDPIAKLDGYRSEGKADDWNDPYSGRIYNFELDNPQGVEIPSTHFEILAYSDEACACELSLSSCQETMEITLSGFAEDGSSEG
jgi:hypothetical protein